MKREKRGWLRWGLELIDQIDGWSKSGGDHPGNAKLSQSQINLEGKINYALFLRKDFPIEICKYFSARLCLWQWAGNWRICGRAQCTRRDCRNQRQQLKPRIGSHIHCAPARALVMAFMRQTITQILFPMNIEHFKYRQNLYLILLIVILHRLLHADKEKYAKADCANAQGHILNKGYFTAASDGGTPGSDYWPRLCFQ